MTTADTPDQDGPADAGGDASDAAARTRRPMLWLLAGGGALIVAGVIAFVATRDGDGEATPATNVAATTADSTAATNDPDATDATQATAATTETSAPPSATDPDGTTTTDASETTPTSEPKPTTDAGDPPETTAPVGATATTVASGPTEPTDYEILFQNTAIGEAYGLVSTLPLASPGGERSTTDLRCERLDAQGSRGLCTRTNRGTTTTWEAVVFDSNFVEGYRVGLAGPASRVRLSPSGDTAAVTSFVTGHEYEADGFSTQTILIDLVGERVTADLEADFEVLRDGAPWREEDFNFWGVTFTDDDRFHATLATGGSHYLVEGAVSSEVMRVIHENGQCPAISPDGDRLAHRVRIDAEGQPTVWRLAVLDLETGEVVMLAEERNVEDQPVWIDEATIGYGLPDAESPAEPDTWSVPADGGGEPVLFLDSAWSLAVRPLP